MRKDVAGVMHLQAGGLWCHYKNKVFVVIESLQLCYLKKKKKATYKNSKLQLPISTGAQQVESHYLIFSLIGVLGGCMACCSVNGRESHAEYEGVGEQREREAEGLEHSRRCAPQKLRGSFSLRTPLLLM